MSKTFLCAWCHRDKPVALLFYAKGENICLWCAEDHGLVKPRFMKGY